MVIKKDFFEKTHKALTIKESTDEFECIKINKFFSSESIIKWNTSHIVGIDICDRSGKNNNKILLSKMQKNFYKSRTKMIDSTLEK